jgi:hypothetical protein
MSYYKDLNQISQAVDERDNVLSISMEDLRNAHGEERLGRYVRASISEDLARMGIGHHPENLPSYQDEYVILYRVATSAADLITGILHPNYRTDTAIRNALSHKATEIIKKIKRLVDDEDD